MTEHEQLEKLIESAMYWGADTPEKIVERLIDEGVICPPCKVGDTVYRFQKYFNDATLQSEVKIKPCRIDSVGFECVASEDFVWMRFDEFGHTVFLTREEAEAALAERRRTQ